MTDKVKKTVHPKTKKRRGLFGSVVRGAEIMDKRCSFCVSKNHQECLLSSDDSSRCAECVRLNQSYCDVRGLSPEQMNRIADHHFRLEDELEAAEEEQLRAAEKVKRLRKQKRIWYDKMRRAVARGITDLEELDRVEREEAEAARQVTTLPNPTDPVISNSAVDVDWGAFDPSLLTFLGSGSDGIRPAEPSHVQGSQ